MLRRADNVGAQVRRSLLEALFGAQHTVVLTIGRHEHVVGRTSKEEFEARCAASSSAPALFGAVGARRYWLYRACWHWDDEALEQAQVHALLDARAIRRQDTIARAKSLQAVGVRPPAQRRASVAEDVKQLVWHRDGGRCRGCGAGSELQFDHVIPVSMGGGSAEENVQVLCGPCNRRKGASVS